MAVSHGGCQPSIYGSPNFYYGGGGRYGACYDPSLSAHNTIREQPLKPGITVRFYDSSGTMLTYISSNTALNPILKLEFEKVERGCGRAKLELSRMPYGDTSIVNHGSRFEIHLWNNPRPIWSGTVVRTPGAGSTERTIKLEGIGFLAQVDRIIIGDLDAGETKVQIDDTAVHAAFDILATAVEAKTQVRRNASKVQTTGGSDWVADTLFYIRTKSKEAFDELADLAGGWIWGVDADRDLFFKPRDTSITSERTLIVGYDLEEWKPVEDSSKVMNYAHIRHGRVEVDLTSPAFGTNFLAGYVKDQPSIDAYGVREAHISAPSLYNTMDAFRFASVKVEAKKNPEKRGLAPKVTFQGKEFEAGACYRVVSRDTVTDLNCKRVRYVVKPSGRTEVTLHLGEDSDDLAKWAADLVVANAKKDAEDRLRSYQEVEARPPQ